MLIHDLSIRLSRTHQPSSQRPMPHIRHLHLVSLQFLLLLIHLLQMILQMLMLLIHLLQVILIRLQLDLLSPSLLFLKTFPQTLQKILIPLHLAWEFLFWKLQEFNMFLRVLLSNIFIPCDDLLDLLSFRFISLLSLVFQAEFSLSRFFSFFFLLGSYFCCFSFSVFLDFLYNFAFGFFLLFRFLVFFLFSFHVDSSIGHSELILVFFVFLQCRHAFFLVFILTQSLLFAKFKHFLGVVRITLFELSEGLFFHGKHLLFAWEKFFEVPVFHVCFFDFFSKYSMRNFTRYRSWCYRCEGWKSCCWCCFEVCPIISSQSSCKFLLFRLLIFMNFHQQRVHLCLIIRLCMRVKEICRSKPFSRTLPSLSSVLNYLYPPLLHNLNQIPSLLLIKLKLHRCYSSVQLTRILW